MDPRPPSMTFAATDLPSEGPPPAYQPSRLVPLQAQVSTGASVHKTGSSMQYHFVAARHISAIFENRTTVLAPPAGGATTVTTTRPRVTTTGPRVLFVPDRFYVASLVRFYCPHFVQLPLRPSGAVWVNPDNVVDVAFCPKEISLAAPHPENVTALRVVSMSVALPRAGAVFDTDGMGTLTRGMQVAARTLVIDMPLNQVMRAIDPSGFQLMAEHLGSGIDLGGGRTLFGV